MNRINAFTSLFEDDNRKVKPKNGKPGDKLRRKAAEGKLGMTYGRVGLVGLPQNPRRNK